MAQKEQVVIGGRTFAVGETYGPAKPRANSAHRRLVGFEPESAGWRGGCVLTVIISHGGQRREWPAKVSGVWWARWAGERVADSSGTGEGA